MAGVTTKITGSATGTKAQNAEFLAADAVVLQADVNNSVTVKFAIATIEAVIIEVTFNSGTSWMSLNSGTELVAGALYEFYTECNNADLINIRTPTGGGCTILRCRVEERL